MKAGKIRTLRGNLAVTTAGLQRQLILDDGLINRGYRVEAFFCWPTSMASTGGMQAVLTMDTASTSAVPSPEDNREIAWWNSAVSQPAETAYAREWNYIDPDHVVVRDLVINANVEINQELAYLIILREYEISDVEAIISIIKEDAQNI